MLALTKIMTIAITAIILGTSVAAAQVNPIPVISPADMKPTTTIANLFRIPINILFSVVFALGSVPLYIVRGFLSVWNSWGFPPIQQILAGFSFVAPAVFRDSLFILAFFAMVEFVILLLIPILGWILIPVAWGITGIGVLLFAIADFVSKINAMAVKEKSSGGGSGWWA